MTTAINGTAKATPVKKSKAVATPDLQVVIRDEPPDFAARITGRRVSQFAAGAAAARRQPGTWVRTARWAPGEQHDTSLAHSINTGLRGFTPPGAFTARAGRVADGGFEVWVQYTTLTDLVDYVATLPATTKPLPARPIPTPAARPQQTAPITARSTTGSAKACQQPGCAHGVRVHDDAGCRIDTCGCSTYLGPDEVQAAGRHNEKAAAS